MFGTIHHDIHRKRRNAMGAVFSKGAAAASEDMIYSNAELLLQRVQDQIKTNGSAEMRTNFLAFSTDTLSHHCFGHNINLLVDDDKAVGWKRTIRAIAILTPLAKQFPWIIPLALKSPIAPLQMMVPDLARIVKLRRVSISRVVPPRAQFD